MDSVPVWVLTAVVEVGFLCMSALGLVTFCLWWRLRRLRAIIRQMHSAPTPSVSPDGALPAVAVPAPMTEPLDEPLSPAGDGTTAATVMAEASLAGVLESPELQSMLEAALAAPRPTVLDPGATAATPEAMPEASEAEGADSGILTQEMLDKLLAGAMQEKSADASVEESSGEAREHVATLMAENTVMEQQLNELQEKNGLLRQSVERLLANASLPLEEQQELPVPEKTMQEIERGLAALQQTRERMQQELQAHCQRLGWDDLTPPSTLPASQEPALAAASTPSSAPEAPEEVRQLQAALEQRTTDYQRIQEEYEQLLNEYQRVFENAAPAEPQATGETPSQAA